MVPNSTKLTAIGLMAQLAVLLLLVMVHVATSAPAIISARHSARHASEVGTGYTFDFGDVFFNESMYIFNASGLVGCSASVCSASCDSSVPLSGPTCLANQTCLNITQGPAYDAATLKKGEIKFYAVTFRPCSNVAVVAFPSSGSPLVWLGQNTFTYPTEARHQWSSADASRPVLSTLCCGADNPNFNGSRPLFLSVEAASDVTYELFVYDMDELLPVKYFYKMAQVTVTCATSECSTNQPSNSCPYTEAALPSNDTGLHYFAQRGQDPLPGITFQSNDAQFSFERMVEEVLPRGLVKPHDPSLEGCSVSFMNLANAAGELVVGSATLETWQPECDRAKFKAVADGLESLNKLYDTANSGNYFELLFYSNAYAVSDGWVGCQAWADQQFVRKTGTYNSTQPSTRCSSVDPTFNASADPCCNFLLWDEVCADREVTFAVTKYEALQSRVEAMCDVEPGCVYLSLDDYAESLSLADDPTRNCAADIVKAGGKTVYDHWTECEAKVLGTYCDSDADCIYGQSCTVFHRCTIACLTDADCPTNSTCSWGSYCSHVPHDTATENLLLAQCVVDRMGDNEKTYIRSLWGLSDEQSEGEAFFDIFMANVTAPTCEGTPEINMYPLTGHCEGSPSCNWAPCQIKPFNANNRDPFCEVNCMNVQFPVVPDEPDHFCALCSPDNPESCVEVSLYAGCYMVGDRNILDNIRGCYYWSQLFPGSVFSNYIKQECVFDAGLISDATTCLSDAFRASDADIEYDPWYLGDRDYVRIKEDGFGGLQLVTDGYCHLWGYPSLCTPEFCEQAFEGPCMWNELSQTCVLKAFRTFQQCYNSRFGSLLYWNHEFAWRLPNLDSSSTCTGGMCFPSAPGVDQTTCESTPWCSVSCASGPCANQTECEAAGECDDTELTNYLVHKNITMGNPVTPLDGVCVFPFQLAEDQLGVTVSCPAWTKQARVGCIDYYVFSEADCLASLPTYGTPRWMRSAATKGECLAYGTGCYEKRNSYAEGLMGTPTMAFLSPKNESECLAVGGVPTPYYTWRSGVWHEGGVWQSYEWKQRNWTTQYNKRLVNDFSLEAYSALSSDAQFSNFLTQLKSDQFCRYNRLTNLFDALTCSCMDSPDGEGNCGLDVGVTSGVSRTCSHTDFHLTLPGAGFVSWNRELAFSPACVDVDVFTVSASQFQKEGDTTFVSNIFVKAIESKPEGYAIIENSHGVIVGQLIGDGLLIELTSGGQAGQIASTTAEANFTVCMYLRSDIALESRFSTYDLAFSNEDYSKWTPMNARDVHVTADGLLCGIVPPPYPARLTTIFPVWRESGDWAGKLFIESLSTSTVALFYLAVGLYALLLLPNTLAIANQFWLFKYELEDSGDKSFASIVWTMFSMGRIIHCCIEAILILRILYFAMLPTGVLNDVNVVVYVILGEVPVYLFLSIYTLLIFFWVELVHWALKRQGATSVLKRMKIMFLIVNSFLYLFLLALVIIYIALEASASDTDLSCSSSYFLSGSDPNADMKDARKGLAIFYQSVIIAIALILAIAFIVYGVWVLVMLHRVRSMSEKLAKLKRNKTIKFSAVLIICTASLLCMCAFLLYGTIDQTMSAVGAIIFVIVVELIPLTLLIFTVYSKRKGVFRLWYSYAASRSRTSTESESRGSTESGRTRGSTRLSTMGASRNSHISRGTSGSADSVSNET